MSMKRIGLRAILFNAYPGTWENRVVYQNAAGNYFIRARAKWDRGSYRRGRLLPVERMYRDSERTKKLTLSNKFYTNERPQ